MGRYRRYLVPLAIVLLLVGLYALAGFWAVPHFARSYAQDFVKTHYARTLTIGDIRFNPFTLKLDIRDLSLPDADGKPMIAFARLHVDLQPATLWRLGPSFKEILLEKPYVRAVIRRNGDLNLADLGKGFPEQPGKKPPATAPENAPPMRLFIGRLAISAGSSVFEDETHPTPFKAEISPIAFELRDFSTRGTHGNAYHLTAASEVDERFDWSGTLRLAPFTSHGEFQVTDLHARTVWDYIREIVPLELSSGMIGLKGDYDLSTGGGPLALKIAVHDTTVTDLGVRPRGGSEDYVKLAKIEVLETRLDLAAHSVEVGKVQLSGGQAQVRLDEQGRVNMLDLASAPAGTPAPEASPAAATTPPVRTRSSGGNGAPWVVSVPDVSLAGLKVDFEDRMVSPALTAVVDPLTVHVTGFNTKPDDALDVTVDSTINGSGTVALKAHVVPSSAALDGHVDIKALALPVIQPYLSKYTSLTLLKGTLGVRADFERHADGSYGAKGSTQVSGLRTVDNSQKRDFIGWKDLKIADIDYRSQPQSLRIKSVTAIELYTRMIVRPDRTLNVTEVLTPAGSKPTAPGATADSSSGSASAAAGNAAPAPPPAAPKAAAKGKPGKVAANAAAAAPPANSGMPFPMSIGTVRFVNTTLDYTDLWIKPSFSVGIQSLNGSVIGLSSDPRSRAKVELNGKVDRYSPAHIGGEVNLLSAALYTDITMSFKDIDLTIVNPYSGHFVGYKIDKGKLSVDVSYKIDQRKLNAQQHFVVDQLELRDRVESPDAIHAPIKLAVALLKDRHGVIDIDLPMSGSIDDPQFRLGPIIWKAFVNLIVKVVTAPFALLGHMFGGGENMNIVQFMPGSAELDKASREQLGALAKSLKERPALKLDVPITYSKELDPPPLAAKHLNDQLAVRVAATRHGKRHPDTALEEALADPQKHYQLLLDQYQDSLGKDTALPESAQAVQSAKRGETPNYEAAIGDLEAALVQKVQVPEADLVQLGKDRARAIQDVLVGEGGVEAARVFIVDTPPKPASGDKVKAELALK